MPVNSINDIHGFCQVLLASGLIGKTALSEVLSGFRSPGPRDSTCRETLTAFTNHLVALGIITSWQCGKLCNGQYKGFFMDGYKLVDHLGDDNCCNRYLVEDRSGKHVVLCVVPPLIAQMKDGKLEYWIENLDS